MKFEDGVFGLYSQLYKNRREVELAVVGYLSKCSDGPISVCLFEGAI